MKNEQKFVFPKINTDSEIDNLRDDKTGDATNFPPVNKTYPSLLTILEQELYERIDKKNYW